MFCAKCGAEMKPTDAFCLKCGTENKNRQAVLAQPIQNPVPVSPRPAQYAAPVAPSAVYRSEPPVQPYPASASVEKKEKKKWPIVLGAILGSLLLIILVSRCFGPKAAVRRYLRAYKNQNAGKVVRLAPKEVLEYYDDKRDIDYDDLVEMLEDRFEISYESREKHYGDNYRVKYEVVGVDNVDGKEARELRDRYEESYDMDGDRIGGIKTVYVLVKISGSEKTTYNVSTFTAINYKGKWYVMDTI